VNIAAIHAGSYSSPNPSYLLERDYQLGLQSPPPLRDVANKIPNLGWALLDVRPGGSQLSSEHIRVFASEAMESWNEGRKCPARLEMSLNFEMPSYLADAEKTKWLFDLLQPVHGGNIRPPGETGFIDVTLLAGLHGTQFISLSPMGGNQHAADEYVDTESVVVYAECVVRLLSRYCAS